MKALLKEQAAPGLSMREIEKPEYGPNDVMIKIRKTAICGTDMHIYNWDEWAAATIPVPMAVGHEYVGEIVAIGDNVSDFEIGQRVSGEGHIVCGHCRKCRSGKQHLCMHTVGVGVNRPGAFAEYLVIPHENVYPIPNDIPDNIAAILDPLGNAAHTALSFDLVGEDVLITGAGPIGMMAAAIASHIGARNVVITDVNPYRLALASKLGKIRVVNAREEKLDDVMVELGMVEGFDVGLEMSGNQMAFNDMINHMVHGGNIALLGILPKDTSVDFEKIIFKGLNLKGIYGREMFETWYKMTALIQAGLDLSPLITHEFPVDQFEQGFQIMNSGDSGKVILNWSDL